MLCFRPSADNTILCLRLHLHPPPQPQVVTKMSMVDNGKAQIDWVLTGQLSAFGVSIPVKSLFELNLLTGRVINHT